MLQFYFLSITANVLAGLTLAGDAIKRRMPGFAEINARLSGRRGKLVFGLASLLVGFCTLFVPAEPPLILGDLLPSAVGMVMGIALLFEVFRDMATLPTEQSERSERTGRLPNHAGDHRVGDRGGLTSSCPIASFCSCGAARAREPRSAAGHGA